MKKTVTADEIIKLIQDTCDSANTSISKIYCIDGLIQGKYAGCTMDTKEVHKLLEWVKKS